MEIHRCRFVSYPASAINAVAFSHSSLPQAKAKKSQKHIQVRLAIGRANGDIEIWNPLNGVWHQELVIPGGKDRSVDGLVWVTDTDEETSDGKTIHGRSRLFSIGYTAAITEWDLEKAKPKKHASGQHGDIWCFAVQPPLTNKNGAPQPGPRKLVAGTVDGNLVVYSIEDDDLRFVKTLMRTPSKNTKMVSIAFQSRNIVVVGCSNSTICVYDIRNGTLQRQMTLGSDHAGGSKNIIVWSVKCLPRGDIVSGDSTGQVCIWDGKTYTQAQRIQSHTQDVLSLAVSADGSRIVSGGMDRRTVLYEPRAGQVGRWSKVFHRRYHTHDVKAMASFEGRGMSVVVSGGPDASPVVFPFRSAGKENHRTLPHLSQNTNLQSAPKARLILSWWGNEIRIWHLLNPARRLLDEAPAGTDIRKNRKLLAQILVKGESNITSAAISEDGTLLVTSTATEVKAFQLEYTKTSGVGQLNIKKIHLTASGQGATRVEISPDKLWVCWIEEGSKVMVARASSTTSTTGFEYAISEPTKLRRFQRHIPKNISLGGLGSYDRQVTQVAFSPDSKMLCVADLAGYIDTWIFGVTGGRKSSTNGEDDNGESDASSSDSSDEESDPGESERWYRNPKAPLFPKLDASPVALTFSPGHHQDDGDYTLLAITNSKQVLLFNPIRGALAEWTRRNTYMKLPEQFRITRDLVKGVVWQGPRAWIYGASFLFMIDLSQDLPDVAKDRVKDAQAKGTKRKRDGLEAGAGGKMAKGESLAAQQLRVATRPDGTEWADVEMADADDQRSVGASSAFEDDDDDDTDGGELQRLRDDQANNEDDTGKEQKSSKWWHTYQYRPILGIVPLADTQQANGGGVKGITNGIPPLEVAIVERPTWELELPMRYFSDGERER
ncbi:quinon protein alcohol dehydrogenase-like superfamily [Lasiosphaeria hispida]|uniref:Quinon protein alcohol dehydrogenase-like superfamily n=1 Tax=Lasiosphaeria hispida TaxID=260671 RepID=A0AAJ0H675_9PEZI|nr:quinon protein alcohol dehydrogenase-like superfamily [Lasiosphaeria hispida]